MAYSFYIAGTPLPVPPPEMTISVGSKNEVVTLIDEGDINIIKGAGLKDISFEVLLPNVYYPFSRYESGSVAQNINYRQNSKYDTSIIPAAMYLNLFDTLKSEKLPFQLDIYRELPNGIDTYNTNITVTLEDYEIKESWEDGSDVRVSLNFKEYRPYGTQKVVLSDDGITYVTVRQTDNKIMRTSTVRKGETLYSFCQRNFGYADDNLVWYIYAINRELIDSYNKDSNVYPLTIYEGMNLKLQDKAYGSINEFVLTNPHTLDDIAEWVESGIFFDVLLNSIPEGELTVTQYETLLEMIKSIKNDITALQGKYNWIDNNMPEWARPTITWLVQNNYLKGDEEGKLRLTDDMLKVFIVSARAGAYGAECAEIAKATTIPESEME